MNMLEKGIVCVICIAIAAMTLGILWDYTQQKNFTEAYNVMPLGPKTDRQLERHFTQRVVTIGLNSWSATYLETKRRAERWASAKPATDEELESQLANVRRDEKLLEEYQEKISEMVRLAKRWDYKVPGSAEYIAAAD